MKINCLSCGHMIELDDEAYSDYEGPFRCWVCGGTQIIKTEECLVRTAVVARSCSTETHAGHCLGDGQPVANR